MVNDGKAIYASSGESTKFDSSQPDKGTGNTFQIWGVQENGATMPRGWVIKCRLDNPVSIYELTPSPLESGLDTKLAWEGLRNSPEAVNQWLESKGIAVVKDYKDTWKQ